MAGRRGEGGWKGQKRCSKVGSSRAHPRSHVSLCLFLYSRSSQPCSIYPSPVSILFNHTIHIILTARPVISSPSCHSTRIHPSNYIPLPSSESSPSHQRRCPSTISIELSLPTPTHQSKTTPFPQSESSPVPSATEIVPPSCCASLPYPTVNLRQ